MHCAVQLSAFLYRAMYSTMQQPLTRTAALKKMINRLSFEWYTEESAMSIYTHLKYNMNTLIFYNINKMMSSYSYCPIS